jgi:hypothetical protein
MDPTLLATAFREGRNAGILLQLVSSPHPAFSAAIFESAPGVLLELAVDPFCT